MYELSRGTGVLREQNKKKVLALTRQVGKTSRQDLAKLMGVSKNTISLIVDEFIHDQVLKEVGNQEHGSIGRPKAMIEINRDGNGYRSAGIAISNEEIAYTVTNYYGETIETKKLFFDCQHPSDTKKKIYELIVSLLKRYNNMLGIGIGIPGIVNINKKFVYNSTHLGWKDVSFQEFDQIEIPIYLQNSVNLGALCAIEKEGIQKKESIFYVRIGEGVGGAFITDNSIINGGSWTAGEIGHISIDPLGELCNCGQRGCLERMINYGNFQRKMIELGYSISCDQQKFLQSSKGKALINEYGIYLGKSLIQVIHLINPDKIIIDAPYNAIDGFKEHCLGYVKQYALKAASEQTGIIFSDGRYSLTIGAAMFPIVSYEKEV